MRVRSLTHLWGGRRGATPHPPWQPPPQRPRKPSSVYGRRQHTVTGRIAPQRCRHARQDVALDQRPKREVHGAPRCRVLLRPRGRKDRVQDCTGSLHVITRARARGAIPCVAHARSAGANSNQLSRVAGHALEARKRPTRTARLPRALYQLQVARLAAEHQAKERRQATDGGDGRRNEGRRGRRRPARGLSRFRDTRADVQCIRRRLTHRNVCNLRNPSVSTRVILFLLFRLLFHRAKRLASNVLRKPQSQARVEYGPGELSWIQVSIDARGNDHRGQERWASHDTVFHVVFHKVGRTCRRRGLSSGSRTSTGLQTYGLIGSLVLLGFVVDLVPSSTGAWGCERHPLTRCP